MFEKTVLIVFESTYLPQMCVKLSLETAILGRRANVHSLNYFLIRSDAFF